MRREKLLWILPYFPYPLFSGGNVRVFNLIKHLGKKMDIDLVSFVDKELPAAHREAVGKYCSSLKVVGRKEREGSLPLIFQYYFTPEMKETLIESLKNRYNFIQIDYLTMAYWAKLIKKYSSAPLFFTEHDVSWMDFDKCFHNRHLKERDRYCEWLRMRRTIDEIYPLFDAVITVSDNDADILGKKYSLKKLISAPTGVDCSYFSYREGRSCGDITYTGHYVHYPNVDSVNYILQKILPRLRKSDPAVKFNIVGSAGKKVFSDIKDKGVIVTGRVDDIRKYLYSSGVFVAPVRLGVGIRGKILEAMAAGLPVVTSRAGAAGIGAEPGKQLLVADTPDDFVSSIQKIKNDKAAARALAGEARIFVEKKYDWPVRASELYSFYRNYNKT